MAQKLIGLTLISLFTFSCQSTGLRNPSSAYVIKAGQFLNCSAQQYAMTFSQDFKSEVEQSVEVRPGTGDIMLANLKFTVFKGKKVATVEVSDCPDEKTQCWRKDIYFDAASIAADGKVKAQFVDFYNGKTYAPVTATCSIRTPSVD